MILYLNIMEFIKTQYANSHGISIAYQVMGDGPLDIIIAPGLISHVELLHEFPGYTRFLKRLAKFARVITFDKRGQGLSGAMNGVPTLEDRVDDMIAVQDAVSSKKAALFGFSEGGPMTFLMAATHPKRVSHIITFGAYAKSCASPDYPHMFTIEQRRENLTKWLDDWGNGGGVALNVLAPDLAKDEIMRRVFARIERYASTPLAMKDYIEVNFAIDVLDIMPAVTPPTLVLQRQDDLQVPAGAGRHLAEILPNGRYVDGGAGGHLYWVGDVANNLLEIRNFLTGAHAGDTSGERVLSTVLFTDIVGSTDKLQALGDGAWRDLLDRHDAICTEVVALYRGQLIRSTGDGILATFDGPGRAVECGLQLNEQLFKIGLPIRAGLHTGEIELRGDGIDGIGVHLAARIESLADEGEILVSRTVTDLMVGNADIHFKSKGRHVLKGIADEWEIFQACR